LLCLKNIVCWDLLSSSKNGIECFNKVVKIIGNAKKNTWDESIGTIAMLGVEVNIPDPVFFCSIEPPSQVNELLYNFNKFYLIE